MTDASQEREWQEAGLYDPAWPHAERRLELLRWITEHGAPLEAMIAASARNQLTSIVGDRALRLEPTLSALDIAERTGLHLDDVRQLRRATGFPMTPADVLSFSADEVATFQLFAVAAAFFSREELLHFVRVIAASVRRIAEAASEMFMRDVEAPLQQGERDELALARANLAGVEMVDNVTALFEPLFRGHLQATTENSRRARHGTNDYSTVPLTIGFVDLSAFTFRSGEMRPDELLRLVMDFEAAAFDLVSDQGGRLIKVIGDEAMFSTVNPEEACAITVGLLHTTSDWGVTARGGLAHGPVVASGGDVYGPIVNLASRITDIAVPGEVLVDAAVVQNTPQRRFEPAGRRLLKGFAEPVRLWSLAEM